MPYAQCRIDLLNISSYVKHWWRLAVPYCLVRCSWATEWAVLMPTSSEKKTGFIIEPVTIRNFMQSIRMSAVRERDFTISITPERYDVVNELETCLLRCSLRTFTHLFSNERNIVLAELNVSVNDIYIMLWALFSYIIISKYSG